MKEKEKGLPGQGNRGIIEQGPCKQIPRNGQALAAFEEVLENKI